jgi:Flp pilus assembly protein TadG
LIGQGTFRLSSKLLLVRADNLSSQGEAVPGELGAALVESAFALTFLLIFMFGIMQVCLALYSFHFVANASHEGTRYAIVRGATWGAACASYTDVACTATPAQIASYVTTNFSFPGIHLATSDVCVEYFASVPASASTSCTANTTPNAAGDIVQVTISHPFTFTIPFMRSYTYNLASTSQMVIAQ